MQHGFLQKGSSFLRCCIAEALSHTSSGSGPLLVKAFDDVSRGRIKRRQSRSGCPSCRHTRERAGLMRIPIVTGSRAACDAGVDYHAGHLGNLRGSVIRNRKRDLRVDWNRRPVASPLRFRVKSPRLHFRGLLSVVEHATEVLEGTKRSTSW